MGELRVTAEGSLGLVDQKLAFTGRGSLSKAKSDELTASGKDFRLLANASGELEFPVKIAGTIAAPDFKIDLGKMAKTAATNAVKKEVTKGLNKLLGTKKK
jgi:autotransporter translocation and assembly factor TamB